MSIADAEGNSLEELLLAVLRSGTPLAESLRTRLHELSIWLLTEFPDEPTGRELMTALMTLRDHGNPAAPGELPAPPNDRLASTPETASDQAVSEDAEQKVVPGEPEAGQDAPPEAITAADHPAPEPEERDPVEETADGLRRLWEKLSDDQVAGRYCSVYGAYEAGAASDAVHELWRRLFLVCLRLPGEQAAGIRGQAEAAVADYPDRGQLAPLVPLGLPEDDVAELADLSELAPELAATWPGLVTDAAWLTWLAWHDEGVECAHEGTAPNETEPQPFDDTRRERFTLHLVNRLKKLPGAPTDVLDPTPLVSVDEALRGVVPIPLPQPGSWWMDCLKRSDRRLESLDRPDVIHVFQLELNTETWNKYFDTKDVVRIQAAETAGNHEGNDRVWILRYPVTPTKFGPVTKGRYIAVK